MVLLDSLYINSSGGLRLLEYLVDELEKKDVDFFLLADSRCTGLFDKIKNVRYMKASLLGRRRFYQSNRNRFTKILCFGNIPAPIKMRVEVYTYFHNINLLTLSESRGHKEKVIMWLKREVFKYYKKNTDYWLVQTSNTANELRKHLKENVGRIKLMPFFDLSNKLIEMQNTVHGNDYVYISNYTGAKGHEELLEAWRLLKRRGIDRTLHLTVPSSATNYCMQISEAKKEGVNVINHGFLPFDSIVDLYKKSKAIVYPSHNESLGLGIVEAITAGCDVIGADLPYVYAICKPSIVFAPFSIESIANAIELYEKNESNKSELLVHNQICELVELLNSKVVS